MNKFGLKEIRTHMGIFDYAVICIIGDEKKVNKYISWKFEDTEEAYEGEKHESGCGARGLTFFKPGYVPVIWIPRKPKTPREYATLSHECLHAINLMFRWVGLKMTKETEEVSTHAMAHLITNILYNLK